MFKIKAGDYIDSREFSKEECERFCEIAMDCGFRKSFVFNFNDIYLGVSNYAESINTLPSTEHLPNNITTQFREFLDKEWFMTKQFSKSDLKDGMCVTCRDGREFYICDDIMISKKREVMPLFNYTDNLTDVGFQKYDIILITDRDGTILFEREEEQIDVSIEEIAKWKGVAVDRVRIKK